MRIGLMRHRVSLSDADPDNAPKVFAPSSVQCAIEPANPGAFDEQRTSHLVQMRYHPQITMSTVLTFTDRDGVNHQLYVRGIQNVDMRNRELRLLCEEVIPQ